MYVGVKPFNTLYTVNMILKNESCRQPVSGYDKGGYMLQQDWDDMIGMGDLLQVRGTENQPEFGVM